MLTYEWTSLNLQVKRQENSLQDTIVAILWAYSCKDSDYLVFDTGRCELPSPDPLNYIPFDQITKDVLVTWLENTLDMVALNAKLANKLEQKRSEDIYLVQFPVAPNVQ
jgi:hypothetical protein